MTLVLIEGGRKRLPARRSAVPMGAEIRLGDISDDPAARRRELMVVLALCAARERGAREIAGRAPNANQSAAAVPKS